MAVYVLNAIVSIYSQTMDFTFFLSLSFFFFDDKPKKCKILLKLVMGIIINGKNIIFFFF